ncbi:multidrug efflux SMR transporter [Poseidonocella sp. HB161398]|uniref:DMT family transporter n=1 Tax=Poseidonocella sp. HB161398 TaxID=2320855 RepID=UPI00272C5040|nr:multidrug efflux SMR transporter [Poseidonocella sp. HB161398]
MSGALPWVLLGLAGCLEVVWALAMKSSEGFTRLWPSVVTVAAILGSLGLLALAMRSLPLGTAYMIWAGIGTLGAFAAGVLLFGEPASWPRLLSGAMILGGIALMKAAS